MPVDTKAFLERWHPIVNNRDLAGLAEVVADDVTMGAPPYWQKFEDREAVLHLLGLVIETIEDFTYHREWASGSEIALEFTGHVGECDLQGVDLISLDGDNRLSNLDVMIRPMNALEELRNRIMPKMMEFFSSRSG